MVCTGKTGHAEAVLVEYDPEQISFEQIVTYYLNRFRPNNSYHRADGQYRSAIFYADETEKAKVELLVAELNEKQGSNYSPALEPAAKFYPAEEYHQNYYKKMFSSA